MLMMIFVSVGRTFHEADGLIAFWATRIWSIHGGLDPERSNTEVYLAFPAQAIYYLNRIE